MDFPPYPLAGASAGLLLEQAVPAAPGAGPLHAAPSMRPGGCLLDGLPRQSPVVLQSRCETLFAGIGYPPPDKLLIESNHRRLMRTCRDLPRGTPDWPRLHQRLMQLQCDLAYIQGRSFLRVQRSELLKQLCRMGEEAQQLVFSLRRKALRRLDTEALMQLDAASFTGWIAPPARRAVSSLESDSLERSGSEPGPEPEPASGSRQGQPVAGQRVLVAAGTLWDPVPFRIDAQGLADMRGAILAASQCSDRRGLIACRDAAGLHARLLRVAGIEGPHVACDVPGLEQHFLDLDTALRYALDDMPDSARRIISPLAWQYLKSLQA
ncbi:hypothetical protein GT347_23300 [Xylophilus rhododendri]|uniref:Uncharacterized protein n=1 Tax=Xylophilus rhododendri TaxID=2697032 RepID=A0A857JBU5_9BURK|nr:hypothetical protein [Xylophilus rhododendri]QHJ00652.1 hypothetical protein GT347_23300 [Xylophilus rhododendri]